MNPPSVVNSAPSVGDALQALKNRLKKTGQCDAESVAEYAMAHLLGIRPLDVYLHAREPLPPDRQARLAGMAERLALNEPIHYVTGFTEFLGRRFKTDPRALIPRPETELLVETVKKDPALKRWPAPRIIDVGTGSGIMAVSLALDLPEARISATDLSPDALALARENARLYHREDRIHWRHADLLEGCRPGEFEGIAANLPYVDTAELTRLDPRVRDYEPRTALDGGPGGLTLIARLLHQAATALVPGGVLWLEIGEDQGAAVRRRMKEHGFGEIRIDNDFAGHDRIARAIRTKPAVLS